MNRRSFNRTMLTGGAVAVLAPSTLLLTGCDAKDLGFYVDTVTGALKQLPPLLPGASALIAKAITIANDLNSAYKKGDFTNTSILFASLSDLLSQIANDAGVNSPTVKTIIAIAGIALMTIANLLKAQAPAGISRMVKTPAQSKGVAAIEAAAAKSDAVFNAVRP